MTITNIIDKNKDEKQCVNKLQSSYVIQKPKLLDSNLAIPLDAVVRTPLLVTLDIVKEELLMLKYRINENERDSQKNLFQYKPPSERYVLSLKLKQKFEKERWEKIPYNDLQKLQGDISFLSNSLRETCLEIEKKGTYTCLMNVILGHAQVKHDDETLETKHNSLQNALNSLIQQLENEKDSFLRELEECSCQLSKLQVEFEEVYFHTDVKMRYVLDWEETRQRQHGSKFRHDEIKIEKEIDETKTKLEFEERVHDEIIAYINEDVVDLKEQLNYWTEQYDIAIENKEIEVRIMKSLAEDKSKAYKNMIIVYETRAQEIEQWNILKELRRVALELLRKQVKAAIKVQAWWRGVMVRRYIGPYAKLKKLKKSKKSKKGKK